MMGCETGLLSPTHDDVEEIDLNSGIKKRSRRSFGGKAATEKNYTCFLGESCTTTVLVAVHVRMYPRGNRSGSLRG